MNPTNMKPVAVLFDAGGTLLGTCTHHTDWYEMFFVRILDRLGVPRASADIRNVLKAAGAQWSGPRCSHQEQVWQYWRGLYAAVFHDAYSYHATTPPESPEDLAEHWIRQFEAGHDVELFSDALPTIQQLRDAGVRLGVVSNFGDCLPKLLEMLGISQYFECVTVSALEGTEKPDPEIMVRTLDRMNLHPADCIYVGDDPKHDIPAATGSGVQPVIVARHRIPECDAPVIRSLTDLPAYLGI